MDRTDTAEMGQLRVDGRVVAEWKGGTIYILDHRDGVEHHAGWPGT